MTTTMSAEAVQIKKLVAQEAKTDTKTLQHVLKDLRQADAAAAKAEKACSPPSLPPSDLG